MTLGTECLKFCALILKNFWKSSKVYLICWRLRKECHLVLSAAHSSKNEGQFDRLKHSDMHKKYKLLTIKIHNGQSCYQRTNKVGLHQLYQYEAEIWGIPLSWMLVNFIPSTIPKELQLHCIKHGIMENFPHRGK